MRIRQAQFAKNLYTQGIVKERAAKICTEASLCTLPGDHQASHLGATGNTDARHSQREGERDQTVQPHHRELSGASII